MTRGYAPIRTQMVGAGLVDASITGTYAFPRMAQAEMRSHALPANSRFNFRTDIESFKMPEVWKPDYMKSGERGA